MKAYKGSFRKKNGELRTMLFSHIDDLPQKFLETVVVGTGSERKYPDGMQLVWDLEADNFRIFNFNTQVDNIKTIEIDDTHFV